VGRREKPPECQGCPLETKGLGFVSGLGPPDSQSAWLGQGPGEQEYETGVPFHPGAPSGSILTRWINESGLMRSGLWVGNTVQCWLPQGRRAGRPYGSLDPPRRAQQHCWDHHVGPQLAELTELWLVVPIGKPAREFLMGPTFGERYCGAPTRGQLPEFSGTTS